MHKSGRGKKTETAAAVTKQKQQQHSNKQTNMSKTEISFFHYTSSFLCVYGSIIASVKCSKFVRLFTFFSLSDVPLFFIALSGAFRYPSRVALYLYILLASDVENSNFRKVFSP